MNHNISQKIEQALFPFMPVDNLPKNHQQESDIVREAKRTFFLHVLARNRTIVPMLGAASVRTTNDARIVYDLRRPITFVVGVQLVERGHGYHRGFIQPYRFQINHVDISLNKATESSMKFPLASVCRPYFDEGRPVVGAIFGSKVSWAAEESVTCSLSNNSYWREEFYEAALEAMAASSLADICDQVSPYADANSVFRFFETNQTTYSPLRGSPGSLRQMPFRGFERQLAIQQLTGKKNPTLADLNEAVRMVASTPNLTIPLDASLQNVDGDGSFWRGCYSFHNASGEVVMLLLKAFDVDSQKTFLVPVTMWAAPGQVNHLMFTIPLPEKQILYNLDKILARPEAQIILVDSVEVAAANQCHDHNDEAVWTSFICDPGSYDQVDWMPLIGRSVCLLVTNHSGFNLAEQYLQAKALADYLKEQGVNLTFAQVEVKYPHRHEPFIDIADFRHWSLGEGEPTVVKDSIRSFESRYEFDEMVEKAAASLLNPPWWSPKSKNDPVVKGEIMEKAIANDKPMAIPYLIRPAISQNGLTFLCAKKGVGKSAIATSLCASIISGKPVFEAVHWTVPTSIRGMAKILYLDLEMDPGLLADRMRDFFLPNLSSDPGEREQQLQNFHIESLLDKPVDFTQKEWQDFVLAQMKELEAQGDPEIPVKLVVFDTYTRMSGGKEGPGTWKLITPMIQAIQKKGASVLILHHLNRKGEVRGFQEKEFMATEVLLMSRDGDRQGPLSDPVIMTPYNLRQSKIAPDRVQFEFAFTKKGKEAGCRWTVVNPLNDPLALFGHIANEYQDKGYQVPAICEMLGISKSSYHEKQKKAEPLLKKNPLRIFIEEDKGKKARSGGSQHSKSKVSANATALVVINNNAGTQSTAGFGSCDVSQGKGSSTIDVEGNEVEE